MGEPYHFFSSDRFFEALAEGLGPGRPWRPVFVEVGGAVYRVLELDGHLVTQTWLLPISLTPVELPEGDTARPTPYLPLVRQREGALEEPLSGGQLHSPYVDFARFESWADYGAYARGRRSNLSRDLGRRTRMLERESGEVRFTFDDADPGAIGALTAWKTVRLDAAGKHHPFREPGLPALYTALRLRGLLVTSSLRAGDRLIAITLHHPHRDWMGFRATAFDPEFARVSPGQLILRFLLREGFERGFREADLLLGDESYKWIWATNTRVVGAVGRQPLEGRLNAGARTAAARLLGPWPRVLAVARAAERRLRR